MMVNRQKERIPNSNFVVLAARVLNLCSTSFPTFSLSLSLSLSLFLVLSLRMRRQKSFFARARPDDRNDDDDEEDIEEFEELNKLNL